MNSLLEAYRSMGAVNNLCIRVLDARTKEVVQEHVSHNMVTNSMLTGIAHYLTGDGVLEQGSHMLSSFVPRYISLGTMGLLNQEQDSEGLPSGLGDELPEKWDDERYKELYEAVYGYDDEEGHHKGSYELLEDAKLALENADCPAITLVQHYLDEYLESGVSSQIYPKIVWPKISNDYETFEDFASDIISKCRACCGDGSEDPLPGVCEYCNNRIKEAKQAYDEALEQYLSDLDALINYMEEERIADYLKHCPGYGADGYDQFLNNGRKYFGLGPVFSDRPEEGTVKCELISDSFPRADISYRDIVPEIEAELPRTIDVVFSAMISTGALKQFRETGKNYVFITECGLWSSKYWEDSGENGLLAGYRIAPTNEWQREVIAANISDSCIRSYLLSIGYPESSITADIIRQVKTDEGYHGITTKKIAADNRHNLKKQIIKVGINQVVQVIWKVQLGSIDEFATMYDLRKQYYDIATEEGNMRYIEVKNKLKAIRNKYIEVDSDEIQQIFNEIDSLA